MTAYALAFFAFGLVAHSLLEVVTRAFYALHDTWTPVKIGIGAMVLNLALALLLIRPLSFGGLALANTIATTLETLALLWLIRPRVEGLGGRRLLASLARALPGTLALAGALLIFLDLASGWSPWLVAGGGILLGGAIYASFALLLGRSDLQPLLRRG
jgi:putative peptidoglycan lipid II flippase